MNYYHEWWENARNNTGIWTKKTYQDYLEKRIKDLETSKEGKILVELEQENTNLKEKLAKVKQEITDSDEIIANLAHENQVKEQAKITAESNLLQVQTDYKNLAILSGKALKDKENHYEKKLKEAQENKMKLFQDNLFKGTLIKELKNKGEKQLTELITEKAEVERDYQILITDLQKFLGKYQVSNFKELDKKINYQVQQLNKQEGRINKLERNLTEITSKTDQAQLIFNNIVQIVAKNSTIIWITKKEIKHHITQLRTLLGWEAGEEKSIPDSAKASQVSLHAGNREKELVKHIEKLTNEKEELKQDIRALKLDKEELLKKLIAPSQPVKKPSKKLIHWQNISSLFTEELIKSWEKHKFTYQQVQEWINIGLTPSDYELVNWLARTKQLTPEQVLNHSDLPSLKLEFQKYHDNK